MLVIREIMYCKPGQVRPLVDKFKIMNDVMKQQGWKPMRIMTDVSAERYWTLVAEMEVDDLGAFERMMRNEGMSEEAGKKFEEAMKGYHDLVIKGRREIYKLEA